MFVELRLIVSINNPTNRTRKTFDEFKIFFSTRGPVAMSITSMYTTMMPSSTLVSYNKHRNTTNHIVDKVSVKIE